MPCIYENANSVTRPESTIHSIFKAKHQIKKRLPFPKADAQKAYTTKIQQTRNHTGSSGITLSSEAVHQSFQQVSWLTDQRSAAPSHAVWHNGLKQHLSPLTVTGSTQDSHLIPFYPCIVALLALNLQGTENWKYSITDSIVLCPTYVNLDFRCLLNLSEFMCQFISTCTTEYMLFHRSYRSGLFFLFSRMNSRFTTSNRRTSSFCSCSW